MMRRLLLVIVLVLVGVGTARAHGYIVRAIPENRAVLERAPVRVQYWFSESLEAAFSTITVRDAAGAELAVGGVDVRDARLLAARLPVGLPDGAYTVDLRIAFASDGHVIGERRAFFVGEASALADETAASGALPLEVAWRALIVAGTTLLFGVYGGYALVFVPAWGSTAHAAGNLPPRVLRRIDVLAWCGLALALIGSVVAIVQQAMVFFDADIGRVLSEGLWDIVRTTTRFGDTWNVRVVLLLLLAALHGASVYVRREQPALVRPFLTANLWALPLLVGTWSISAHAAGSPVLPWAALASDWLHGIGVGLWVGGVAALALVLPAALHPLDDGRRRAAILAALRRFSPLAVGSLAAVIGTGVYSASNWITRPEDAADPYGLALALKLALIAPVLWLAWLQRRALRGGMARVGALRGEAALAAGVLVCAALLSATPVPPPDLSGRDIAAPTVQTAAGDYQAAITIAPGGPGVNTYDVVVTRSGQPIEAAVRLRLADPARDLRGALLDADPLGDGVYTAAGADIDRPGTWWLLADIDGERAAFAFEARADAAVAQTRDPSLVNLLALAGALAALGYAVYPLARRFVRWLDLRPAALAVAAAAVLATVGVVVVAGAAVNNAEVTYLAALNPPPAVVNPTLPDADSLARGEAALMACGWGGGALDELVRRLERTRDEALYAAVGAGWRDLPPCPLDEPERWDMVNFIRSME